MAKKRDIGRELLKGVRAIKHGRYFETSAFGDLGVLVCIHAAQHV